MRRIAVILMCFSIIFLGCSPQNLNENSELQNNDDTTTESESKEISSFVFKVSDNYLIHEDGKIRIEGRVLQNESGSSSFADAEKENGVFPSFGRITLKFEEEIPLRVHWSIDDGVPVPDSNRKNVIEKPQNTTVIDIGVSKEWLHSSNYDTMSNRKLRIVCQYRTYSVEYLLVISAKKEMEI